MYVLPCNAYSNGMLTKGAAVARPRYTIQAGDVFYVRDYMLNALDNPDYDVKSPGPSAFRRYLGKLGNDSDDLVLDAEILNRWCETCLNSEQWTLLKATIRKRRYLAVNSEVTVSLTPVAHDILVAVKEAGQAKTLSEAIVWLKKNTRNDK